MKKFTTLVLGIVMATSILSGCSSKSANGEEISQPTQSESQAEQNEPEQNDSQDTAKKEVTGSITMSGSTSMEKFVSALNESFMAEYNGEVTAQAEFTGSSAGIEAVAAGTIDIGNSSRALKDEEKAKGVVENIVAIDGIGVVVDNSNSVNTLSSEDIAKIYTGEIKNWNELGGADQPIIVIGRESGSGTRGAFEEILDIEDKCAYAQEIDSTGAVMAKVASIQGAIGYVSVDVIDDTVKAINVDGVEPTTDNIKSGSYKLSRPFVMATKGEISEQSDAVKALFDYINSDAGQEIISKVGLVSVK